MTNHSDETPTSDVPNFERLSKVKKRTGLGRSTIYRKIALGDFPKQVKLGERASGWPEHEVTAWIASRIAARDQGASR